MSIKKTAQAIDELIERHDPGALRRARDGVPNRDVQFGSPGDPPGYTSLWARLFSADAALDEKCVQEMAYSVCDRDPRGAEERRADALSALIQQTTMSCLCGDADCEATRGNPPDKNTIIYIVADRDTITAETDSGDAGDPSDGGPGDGDPGQGGPGDGGDPVGEDGDESGPESCAPAAPAFVFGAGILPAVLLSPLMARARIRTVSQPGGALPETRYIPSRALADFIRCRDLTCRFPGCDAPATDSDIDHTVPYPVGPTHASNLKCLCRFHHLLKTFWTGATGWQDRQLPDGTIIWTSPTGHTYTTHPAGAALFPALGPATPVLWDGDPPRNTNTEHRGAMMPRRRHNRAQNRARAITAERRLNDDLVAEHNRPPPF
ncbi:HNH endonuclease signature motif containing protein [Mycolicibacterium vanbaalenii]|uniref:HNH endonuclease signature motif containing protein n=1 Tax=Mycolicibacterium vanbaalenii TaxID=110539 RepID=UPI00307F1929